jgi:hypothetical protein
MYLIHISPPPPELHTLITHDFFNPTKNNPVSVSANDSSATNVASSMLELS